MGLDLASHFSLFQTLARQASEVLGFDLTALITGDDKRLNQTAYTQPALLWAGYASFLAFRERGGPAPDLVCGHSLGEYTALVAVETLSFTDAIRLVHERGRLMQQQVAADEALMAAVIGLDDEQVSQLCADVCSELGDAQALSPANFNSKGQVVIAGKSAALASLHDKGKALGAKRVLPLAMSVPSHCPLMEGARTQLAAFAEDIPFNQAQTPVVQNLDATKRTNGAAIKIALLNQLTHPVRWRQSMEAVSAASDFVESGPGNVLQGLAKRSLADTRLHGIGGVASFNRACQSFGLPPLPEESECR